MRAEHLIIRAGMAGLVLYHFLRNERVVPEQFEHPIMRALLPKVRALPSCAAKHGTTFFSEDGVASFPLPPSEVPNAMHVARAELEQLMAREWKVPIAIEKVESIDLARKIVRTNREQYEVEGLIIDRSGPAMVLAGMLGDVSSLWPVWVWGLSLSYLALSESNYPFDASVKSLLERIASNLGEREADWLALHAG